MPPQDLPPIPYIDAYKAGVDMTIVRQNLRLTPTQRLEKLAALNRGIDALRRAGERHRQRTDAADPR
ncbi:MAG: hypothetical protein ACRCT8_11535 [Lacipirellulaceae bacterium]